MPIHLIFLFLFQSGLAFAFSYFIARILMKGATDGDSAPVTRGMRMVRNLILGLNLIIPLLVFLAYYKSLPEGKPATLALWPGIWIFMILAAVVAALSLALRKPVMESRDA